MTTTTLPDDRHLCHATGCDRPVPPRMFMCKPHWNRLPAALRWAVVHAYRPGQEIDKRPSDRYLAVSRQAIVWLQQHPSGSPKKGA